MNRYAGQLANSLGSVSKSPGPNASGSRTTGRTYQQYKTNASLNVNKAVYAGYVGGGISGNGSQGNLACSEKNELMAAQRSNSSKQFYKENVPTIHHHGMTDPRMMSGGAMTTMAQRPVGGSRSGASIVGI